MTTAPPMSLASAARALDLGRDIDRHDRRIVELMRLPEHVERVEAFGPGVPVEVTLGFPFGEVGLRVSGSRALDLIEAIVQVAGAEREAMIAALAALGFAHTPAGPSETPEPRR